MVAAEPNLNHVWEWLDDIADPEIPALSILDLGIVRDVRWDAESGALAIAITPTYSGCPAMDAIASDIRDCVRRHGIANLRLETLLSPPWTTDWITRRGKDRLREFGIAPPSPKLLTAKDIAPLRARQEPAIACPHCGSNATELVSRFASTACKAHYVCRACLEPFDAFKQH